MPYLGGCIATPSVQVHLIPWFGWRLRMVIFQFGPFTPFWQVEEWNLSCTTQCGFLGPLLELAFLLGRQLGLRFWHRINLDGRIGRCHIGATCARWKRKWEIIYFCIVRKQVQCANWFVLFFTYSGWCILRWGGRGRGVLLSWNGVLVGKKRKKAWKVALLCFFFVHLEGM